LPEMPKKPNCFSPLCWDGFLFARTPFSLHPARNKSSEEHTKRIKNTKKRQNFGRFGVLCYQTKIGEQLVSEHMRKKQKKSFFFFLRVVFLGFCFPFFTAISACCF